MSRQKCNSLKIHPGKYWMQTISLTILPRHPLTESWRHWFFTPLYPPLKLKDTFLRATAVHAILFLPQEMSPVSRRHTKVFTVWTIFIAILQREQIHQAICGLAGTRLTGKNAQKQFKYKTYKGNISPKWNYLELNLNFLTLNT